MGCAAKESNITPFISVEDLLEKHMRLVHFIAQQIFRQYASLQYSHGIVYDDLVQIGTMGLIKAGERFDTAYGTAFSTYAVPMIRGEIQRVIRDGYIVKTPRTLLEVYYRIKREGLAGQPAQFIAEQLGVKEEIVFDALRYNMVPASFQHPVMLPGWQKDSAEITLEDIVHDERDLIEELSDNLVVEKFLQSLSERDRAVWLLYYREEWTQKEVATHFGISQVQISRILKSIELKAVEYGKQMGVRS